MPKSPIAPAMSAEDMRASAYRFSQALAEAVKTGNVISFVEQFCTPDFTLHICSSPITYHRAEYIDLMNAWHTAFPDMHTEIRDVMVEGDKMAIFQNVYYTHTGNFAGFAPTGNSLEYEQMSISRVIDGRTQECWLVYDSQPAWEKLMPQA